MTKRKKDETNELFFQTKMENFKEIKEALIQEATKKNAREDQIKPVKDCDNWEQLREVIADNIWIFQYYGIEIPNGHYKSSEREFTIVNGKLVKTIV